MPNQKINFQIPVVGGAFNTNEDDDVRVIHPVVGHFVSTSFMVARVMARRQGQWRWLRTCFGWQIGAKFSRFSQNTAGSAMRMPSPKTDTAVFVVLAATFWAHDPKHRSFSLRTSMKPRTALVVVVVVVGGINKRLIDTYSDPTNTNCRRYTILTKSCQSKNQLQRK